jgi:hypothetical protein
MDDDGGMEFGGGIERRQEARVVGTGPQAAWMNLEPRRDEFVDGPLQFRDPAWRLGVRPVDRAVGEPDQPFVEMAGELRLLLMVRPQPVSPPLSIQWEVVGVVDRQGNGTLDVLFVHRARHRTGGLKLNSAFSR